MENKSNTLKLKMSIIDNLSQILTKFRDTEKIGFKSDNRLMSNFFQMLEKMGISDNDTKNPMALFKKLDELDNNQLTALLNFLAKRNEFMNVGVNESLTMNNKKLNKALLSEELKKFNKLIDYNYYDTRGNVSENFPIVNMEDDRPETPEDDKILLGMSEAEETDTEDNFDADVADITSDIDANAEAPADETPEAPADAPTDAPAEVPAETPEATPEMPVEEPAGDEIELDVTELVKGSEAAKQSADAANDKIAQLMNMVNKLESQLSSMSNISNKIDDLEKQIEYRNPTPVEKLEMRSLDSFPYNIKLSDFWAEKGEKYDTGSDENKPTEYVLTQNDVDNDYIESDIEDSFDADEYEENNM